MDDKTITKSLIDKIETDIMNLTGLTKKQLDIMDMGDIERYLGIEAIDPAKQKTLYKRVSSDVLEARKKNMDKLSDSV